MTGPGDQVPYDQLDSMDQAAMSQARVQQMAGAIVSPFGGAGGPIQAAAAADIAEIQKRAGQKAELAQAMSAGTSMRVDPDQVDGLARFFEDRAQMLEERQVDLAELASVEPPANDPVSTQAAAKYGQVGAGDDRAYLENYMKLSKVFRGTAENLRASAQQTRTDDQNAQDSFRGGDLA